MADLICEDCGEVLQEDLSEAEADGLAEGREVEDQRDKDPEEGSEGEESPGGEQEEQEEEAEETETESKQPDRNDIDDLQEDVEEDVEDEYQDKVDEMEDDETPDEVGNDAAQYYDAADEADVDEPGLLMGKDESIPQGRWEQCQKDASAIARIFRDKLRQKQRSRTHRKQRSGRFDSQELIDADRGSPRVFKREEEGKKLDYEVYFLLDRSSSMRSDGQKEAEEAIATMMKALEDCGVKTELVEFMGSTVNVVKTKSQNVDDEVGNILRLKSTGGTPINEVMDLLAERITGTQGQPFVVSVTDAEISGNTKTSYLETIETMNAPVLGVTIGDDAKIDQSEARNVYHYSVQADVGEPLKQKLSDLARNVML